MLVHISCFIQVTDSIGQTAFASVSIVVSSVNSVLGLSVAVSDTLKPQTENNRNDKTSTTSQPASVLGEQNNDFI